MNTEQILQILFVIALLLFVLADFTRPWRWREKRRDRRSCPRAAPLGVAQNKLIWLLDQDSDTVKIEVNGRPQVVTVRFEKRGPEPLTAETVKAVRRQVRNMLRLPLETCVRLLDLEGNPHGELLAVPGAGKVPGRQP